MAFPETWINELMNKNEIVSVISEYTHLAPKGGRMWGLCPFHPERQASFSVSPDKQLFHCFSCKAGGSVIQFIMQAESLSYPEAVRFLAQRVGMNMPDEVDDEKLRAEKALRDRLYDANRDAAKFYHNTLRSPQGEEARKYLIRRGIDGSTAVRFGLGYSPNDWDALYKYMTGLGYTRDELIAAGLCIKGRKDENRTYDFFRGRLMFPVISASGMVLAFGGRIIDGDDGAKYMNTGDTLIYNKRHNVYAINLMKGKKLDELIMVEGYMDVISLHQSGIENAVASLGTALTSQQVRLMSRFAKRVIYAYDGDAAGQKAMLRGVDILSAGGVEPRVINIPGNDDPDEYVRKYGRDAFMSLRDSSITAVQFKLNTIISDCDLEKADGRQAFAERACKLLSTLEPVERDRYIAFVSEKSGVSREVLREQCGLDKKEHAPEVQQQLAASGYKRPLNFEARLRTEIILAACMITSADNEREIENLHDFDFSLFTDDGLKQLTLSAREAYRSGRNVELRSLLAGITDAKTDAAADAAARSEEIENPIDTAHDCIAWIINGETEQKIRKLASDIEKETDPAVRRELLRQQMELIIKKRAAD